MDELAPNYWCEPRSSDAKLFMRAAGKVSPWSECEPRTLWLQFLRVASCEWRVALFAIRHSLLASRVRADTCLLPQ